MAQNYSTHGARLHLVLNAMICKSLKSCPCSGIKSFNQLGCNLVQTECEIFQVEFSNNLVHFIMQKHTSYDHFDSNLFCTVVLYFNLVAILYASYGMDNISISIWYYSAKLYSTLRIDRHYIAYFLYPFFTLSRVKVHTPSI